MLAYTLLQRDNTQTSVELLFHISTQLSSLTVVPPYINSTISPSNAGLSSFQPSAAARWINSLWFLSLILCLTSAVLGILAKQWIREYLKWNSATGAPRDNILVRQIRAEAWDDWHAPALIASIPALLELAITLFVCGLTIFLWTLDLVVAIVVTISAVNFFAPHCDPHSPADDVQTLSLPLSNGVGLPRVMEARETATRPAVLSFLRS